MPENNTPLGNAAKSLSSFVPTRVMKQADANEAKMFESFLTELTDDDDAPPVCACRDARYYIRLQRDKMNSLGVSVKETISEAGALNDITGLLYDSPFYTAHRLFRGYMRKSVYSLNGRKIYTYKDRLVLYQTLIDAKRGLPHDAGYICPNCGAISKISELENGCKYCRTRFIMSELFPKITEHYWLHDYSMSKGDMNKRILRFTLAGLGTGLALGLILQLTGLWGALSDALYPGETLIPPMIPFGILGTIAGGMLSTLTLAGRVFLDAGKSLPLLSRTSGTRKKLDALRQYDPCYFYEAFEGRVISLLKIMLYSNDLSNNAAYFGERRVPPSDVIEAVFKGAIEVKNIIFSGYYATVTLTVFADCLHMTGGSITRKSDEYRMVIVRNIGAVTDQGFSIIKVECPTCGGSFDATRTRRCPYCNNDYHLYDFDWAVYAFEKRK